MNDESNKIMRKLLNLFECVSLEFYIFFLINTILINIII